MNISVKVYHVIKYVSTIRLAFLHYIQGLICMQYDISFIPNTYIRSICEKDLINLSAALRTKDNYSSQFMYLPKHLQA